MTTAIDRGIEIYFDNLVHAEQSDAFGQITTSVKEIAAEVERALLAVTDLLDDVARLMDDHDIAWGSDDGRRIKSADQRVEARIDAIASACDETLQLIDRCVEEAS